MELSPVMQKFVLHWGEMGARWGINRTVGQIHALLYLSAKPLNAEEIADTLGVWECAHRFRRTGTFERFTHQDDRCMRFTVRRCGMGERACQTFRNQLSVAP